MKIKRGVQNVLSCSQVYIKNFPGAQNLAEQQVIKEIAIKLHEFLREQDASFIDMRWEESTTPSPIGPNYQQYNIKVTMQHIVYL